MSDPFTMIVVFFKPFNILLTAGLIFVILPQLFLVRTKSLIRKINTHEKKFTKQYDKRFLKFLEFLRKSSSNAGLSKSDSNTIREMLLFLISKHPTHVDLFNSVLSSIEKYVYGKTPPSNSDFKNFSKSMSVLRS
jgi:hypothetical protein